MRPSVQALCDPEELPEEPGACTGRRPDSGGPGAAVRFSRPLVATATAGIGLWRSLVAHLTGGQGVAGSNPVSPTDVMSRDTVDRCPGTSLHSGLLFLVGPGGTPPVVGSRGVGSRVELAEEFAGVGVDDADVEVVDEQDDVGAGEASAEADVVQAAVVAQGDACRLGRSCRGGRGSAASMLGPVAVALGRAV